MTVKPSYKGKSYMKISFKKYKNGDSCRDILHFKHVFPCCSEETVLNREVFKKRIFGTLHSIKK